MTIHKISDIPNEALVGKFFCVPDSFYDRALGWPAVIEKATPHRITYRRLYRGDWDSERKEWQILSQTPVAESVNGANSKGADFFGRIESSGPELCGRQAVHLVCDTAVEAIALYNQALATEKAIATFRTSALASLRSEALAGRLPGLAPKTSSDT